MKVLKYEKHLKHLGNRPTMHVVQNMCFREFASYPRKGAHWKSAFFQHGPLSFLECVFYHVRDAQKKILGLVPHFTFFREAKMGPGAHFDDQGLISGRWVLPVSVDGAVECQMTCQITCFCGVSLSGTMRSAISVLLEKTRLGDLLAAEALGCHLLDGEKLICRAGHNAGKLVGNTVGFEEHVAVVHGCAVSCVDVRRREMCKKSVVL